ncbi:GerAB/ArcD/ProY family transporter [Calidifontibacillus oryziterrae]|uniref:GerAB/ArcD/ProY family transporter n=1 Tax=Calidifontibacillus oryziterrae TaxID=1191699 RepID=UPI00030FA2D9|nr:endospore germination permease [Calidifontibacillus oryziterrae]
MLEKGRISPLELSVLIIFFTIGTILAIPSVQTAKANQDAWLSSLIGIFVCVGLAYFYWICAKPMGRATYSQYLEKVYGKIVGKIISLTYVFFWFIGATTLTNQFGKFITTQMLVGTPIEVVSLLLTLLIIFAVKAGLEVIARTGELLIPWFMILFFALVIFLIPQIDLERLSPLYEASFQQQFSATMDFIATAGFPLIAFLMFFPGNMNVPDKSKWNLIAGVFVGAFIVGVFVFLCIVVLGATTTARQMYTSYVLAKSVSLFDIIERIEAVMASMWILTIFFKTAIYFYSCVVCFADVLNVKQYRFLAIPIGILTLLYSTIVYPNVAYMSQWYERYWVPYSLIMGFIIPLLTLIIDKMKSRFKQTNNKVSTGVN